MATAQQSDRMSSGHKEPTLSVCMMVKNEEEFLPGCLESVREVADEIIIVDTGSTDKTVEIAERFGARVFHHPWENDFSKHRNQSISYATCDWILQIDADERLQAESAQRLKQVLGEAETEITVFFVQIHDRNRKGQLKAVFNFPRLYRNHAGVRYKGTVHNQVVVEGAAQKAFARIAIDHFGYDLSEEEMEKKFERTTRLLFKQLEERPDDPFVLYNLTNSFGMSGRAQEAIEYGLRTLEVLRQLDKVSPMYIGLYYPLINAHLQLERYEEAFRHASDSVKILPTYIDGYYSLVRLSTVLHRLEQVHENAKHYFALRERLLADPSEFRTMNIYTLEKEAHVHYYEGLAYAVEGRWDLAESAFARAYEGTLFTERLAGEFLYNLAQVDAGEVLVRWKQKCHDKFGTDLVLAAEVLGRTETPEEIHILGALFPKTELLPPEDASSFLRSAYSYLLGDYTEALQFLRQSYDGGAPSAREALLIADILQRIGRSEDARTVLEVAFQAEPASVVGLRLAEVCRRTGKEAAAFLILRELLARSPEDARVMLALGLLEWQSGSHLQALTTFTNAARVLGMSPKAELDSLRDLAQLLYEIGKVFDDTTRLAIAKVAYQCAVAVDASFQDAAVALARLELRLDNALAGLEHLSHVVHAEPNDADLSELLQTYEQALSA